VKSGTEVSMYKYNKKAPASISTSTLKKLAQRAASKL
jgi:hypothetical protein